MRDHVHQYREGLRHHLQQRPTDVSRQLLPSDVPDHVHDHQDHLRHRVCGHMSDLYARRRLPAKRDV
jgi:hypothetical protein